VAYPDAGKGHAAESGAAGAQAPGGTGPVLERLRQARLLPTADEFPDEFPAADAPWLSSLSDGSQRPVSRVATHTQAVQRALRLGRIGECMAALDRQRAAAGNDPAALVWALTASATCRSVFGQLEQARADLAAARKACYYSTPLLAEPFWLFTEIVCKWLGGDWAGALSDATAMDVSQISVLPSGLAGTVGALRMELLRGVGLPVEGRQLAARVAADGPAEMSAWAQAGVDVDDERPADALRRLADVCDVGTRGLYRTALPLVLYRIADIAFSCGEHEVTSFAAGALAGLDQASPVNEILSGLARTLAGRDPGPARRAQQVAEAGGAGSLAAEALTVRGRVPRPAFPPAGHSPAGGPVPLTARERSVAMLVHEGRSNQQIASTLNISVKTVEAYLTRLYRKTSCSSRVELAVAVTEQRLLLGEQDT
jgi:DNA-binding NarL/FixJ family response regulator